MQFDKTLMTARRVQSYSWGEYQVYICTDECRLLVCNCIASTHLDELFTARVDH